MPDLADKTSGLNSRFPSGEHTGPAAPILTRGAGEGSVVMTVIDRAEAGPGACDDRVATLEAELAEALNQLTWRKAELAAQKIRAERAEAEIAARFEAREAATRASADLFRGGFSKARQELERLRKDAADTARRLDRASARLEGYRGSALGRMAALVSTLSAFAQGTALLFAPKRTRQAQAAAATVAADDLFDAAWYADAYPDVRTSGMDAALHYVRFGAAEGRDPGPRFSTRQYLDAYPDVRSSGLNPLVHFIRHGRAEGRTAADSDVPRTRALVDPRTGKALADDVDLLRSSPLFDVDWYLATYHDVLVGGADPVLHYLTHGAAERRDPSPAFSTSGYLRANPDVAEAGANPLVHYLVFGVKEGRPRPSVREAAKTFK